MDTFSAIQSGTFPTRAIEDSAIDTEEFDYLDPSFGNLNDDDKRELTKLKRDGYDLSRLAAEVIANEYA